jgi:hypothetical protein
MKNIFKLLLLLTMLALTGQQAIAQITVDATSQATIRTAGGSTTWNHAGGTGLTCAVVGLSIADNAQSVSDVQYGTGNFMVKQVEDSPGATYNQHGYLYTLSSPPSGTQTITVRFGSGTTGMWAGAITFKGTATANNCMRSGSGNTNHVASGSQTPAVTITTVSGDVVIGMTGNNNGRVITVNTGTQFFNPCTSSCSFGVGAGSYISATSTTQTMNYTMTSNSAWLALGLSVQQAQVGPTISVQPTAQIVTDPSTATFGPITATASGGGSLSYQWYRNPSGACNTGSTVGTSSTSYTTSATDGQWNGNTFCVGAIETGGTSPGTTYSNIVGLTVNGAPNVTAIGSLGHLANSATGVTLTGTNLKGTSNSTMTIGGVSQTITSQSTTAPAFTVVRGTLCYGSASPGANRTLILTADNLGQSNSFTNGGDLYINPQSGWSYVNLVSPGTGVGYINATPALATGDQLAWNTQGGKFTINADASFVTDPSVNSTQVEACVGGGTGWGSLATQIINSAVPTYTMFFTISLHDEKERLRVFSPEPVIIADENYAAALGSLYSFSSAATDSTRRALK